MTRREWRRLMAECEHRTVEIEDCDGTEYSICKECLWIMPGIVKSRLQAK